MFGQASFGVASFGALRLPWRLVIGGDGDLAVGTDLAGQGGATGAGAGALNVGVDVAGQLGALGSGAADLAAGADLDGKLTMVANGTATLTTGIDMKILGSLTHFPQDPQDGEHLVVGYRLYIYSVAIGGWKPGAQVVKNLEAQLSAIGIALEMLNPDSNP